MTDALTLSYDAGPTDVPLLDETIGECLARAASTWRDREALVSCHQGVRYTYGELDAATEELARGLIALGLDTGDRLGIWSPNYAEWVLVQLATARIGVILVTINPAYRTSELEYALNQSSCRTLIAAPSFKTSDYRAMVADVRPRTPALEHVIHLWSAEWDELLDIARTVSRDQLGRRERSLSPDDAINIQYTSGTTGFPKGATLTHRNILNNGYFVGRGCGYTHTDRVCIPVPFYHCFGMVMGNLGCLTHGAAMIVPNDAFEPGAVLRAVADEGCTSLYGVPTMFIAELGHPDLDELDLSSLRTGIMAGSSCPVEVMKQCIERMGMTDVTICYGMTETSPVSTQTGLDDDIDHRCGTVGKVHPHVEIRIVDPETGAVVPRGTSGEFCTRGYSVMKGYWDDPERTAGSIDAEGYMHTGDLATMDDDGYVNIVGRIKDMIVRGGENVYPREVEEFLHGHPDIVDVQVIGVPDPHYGEAVMAWVQVRPGATLTTEDVADYCRERIAHFKVPKYVKVVEDFPMTVTGKVQKYLMRRASMDELGLVEEVTA